MSAPRLLLRNSPAFGRRQPVAQAQAAVPDSTFAADAKLFLLTFLAGLIFMTIYLA